MRHRLQHKVFDGGGNRSSSPQKSRTSSTFTHSYNGKNPHLAKSNNKLHSKSTYFYRWSSRLSSKLNYVVPSVCTLTLLVGGMVCINPTLDNRKVYAEELDFDASNADSTSNDSGIMTASDPAINLTIAADSGNTNGNIEVGKVAYFSNTITVGGTGISKYYLTLSTPSGSTGNLVGQKNPASTVGKVDYGAAPANFGDNTWGYAVSDNTSATNNNLTYNPVPSGTSGNNSAYLATKNSAPATTGDKYKLVFAAKLGSNMPGDHYQANVYVSAVADAEIVASNWFVENAGIHYMHQMTSVICKNAPENASSQLIDSRDGKSYWVTKLKDGNCWMTQNLDYDIPTSAIPDVKKITDLKNWNLSTNDSANGQVNNDTAAYYDPGNYYYNGNNNSHAQNNGCSNTTGLSACVGTEAEQGFATVGDAHYHVGNYYSWDAATTGSMSGMAGGDSYNNAPLSICPSGWQLPTSRNTNDKSFAYLMNVYSISNNTNLSQVYSSPLYFVYGGYPIYGQLAFAGHYGRYWSSTPAGNANDAYLFGFGSSVDPFDNLHFSSRYTGYSVRCVAQ